LEFVTRPRWNPPDLESKFGFLQKKYPNPRSTRVKMGPGPKVTPNFLIPPGWLKKVNAKRGNDFWVETPCWKWPLEMPSWGLKNLRN